MQRRRFLAGASRAALGLALAKVGARAAESSRRVEVPDGTPDLPILAQIERAIPPLMKELSVPGVSLAAIQDATLIWRRTFGVRDQASKDPVTHETIFEAASVSKTVFAYAALKFCERGTIGLDIPLTRYGIEPFLKGDPRLEKITARHVLSHTSGFQNWRSEEDPLKIQFAPGEKYAYSGEGYCYLQAVLTHLAGQPIDALMRARLFEPFGMETSGYVWNETFARRAARPHNPEGQPEDNRKRTPADAVRYAAAGDLHTTPTEYAKFLIEILAPKPADDFRLSATSLKEMTRPQVKVNEFKSWGLGWELPNMPQGTMIQHGGNNRGFHSYAAASLNRKTGLIIMTNGENGWKLIASPPFRDRMVEYVAG